MITILLFVIEVFSLGFALETSNVAVNFSVGKFVVKSPKKLSGREIVILPEVSPLVESVDVSIFT